MAEQPDSSVQQPQTQDSVVFQNFTGITNSVTKERLKASDLEIAKNIDIDIAGQVRRRRGYKKVATGVFHSIYSAHPHRYMYGVKDGNLVAIYPDYTTTLLKAGVGDAKLAYVTVGENTYFSSETASGVIHPDKTVHDWGARVSEGTWLSPIVNPTETLNPTFGKLLGKPPLATDLTYFNGRIYLAQGQTIWATELYLYNYVDKTKNWIQFESDVTLLRAVSDGIYVGTKTDVWFLSGAFNEMRRVKVHPYGAVPGSAVYVPTDAVETQRISTRTAIMFMSDWGLCTGLDGGYVVGVTHDRVWFPTATSASAFFRVQDGMTQYVGVNDSGGSPTSRARIGDYADAEIRRFQGA